MKCFNIMVTVNDRGEAVANGLFFAKETAKMLQQDLATTEAHAAQLSLQVLNNDLKMYVPAEEVDLPAKVSAASEEVVLVIPMQMLQHSMVVLSVVEVEYAE